MKRFLILAQSGLLATTVAGCSKKEAPTGPPPDVYVADVVQKDVPVYTELVGQTKGSQDVEIRARVEGYLQKVAFGEGSFVRKGELLYQIDPSTLAASLAQAKANLATAQARLDAANISVNRLKPLAEQQAVSRQELDNAVSTQDAARAQVDAGRAQVEKAGFDLGYARIASPIDGVVGTTQVRPGNLVGRGESTLLTTVSAIDPILFRAGISETEYLRLARRAEELKAPHTPAAQASVRLLLADGSAHEQPGRLDAVERAVDPTTGTLAVQFRFPNPAKLLRPGQYGRVRFQSELRKGALLVPQRAVQELQDLHTLAVVGADNKVTIRNVKTGPRVESLWVIDEGLRPGERVIVEGLQRVRDGMTVTPKPQPAAPAGGVAEPAAGLGGTK